jgi:hypothetical protein
LLTPRLPDADGKLQLADLHPPLRLLAEDLVPATGLVVPGADEGAAAHHDHPHAEEAVGLSTAPEADDLRRVEGGHDGSRETRLVLHSVTSAPA